ncbi:MAG: hypothetical protein SNJ59_16550 [Aggregatilineales bacterium]
MFKRVIAALASIFLAISACGPEPTPLPVDLPAPTSTPATAAETRTYTLAIEARLLPLIPEADLRAATRSSEVVRVETALDSQTNAAVDLLVGLGDFPGSTQTRLAIPLWLGINSETAPLDQDVLAARLYEMLNTIDLREALPGAVQSSLIATVDPFQIRNDLANSGFPDGFALSLVVNNAPGAEAIAGALQHYGIDVRIAPHTNGTAYSDSALILFIDVHDHAQMTQRFGNAAIVELARLPVSYRAAPGLTIALTENGWPLLIRESLD